MKKRKKHTKEHIWKYKTKNVFVNDVLQFLWAGNQCKTKERKGKKDVKVLYVFFLFTFFKNSVCNPKAKFVNKGSNTLFEVTSTGLLNIGWSYKLVKGCRPKSAQFNWRYGDAVNYPFQWV